MGNVSPKPAFMKRVWPFLFIIPTLYLAVMSDPDVWSMGQQGWLQAFRNNPEAAQHKIFAALLLALGITEFQRSHGKPRPFLAIASFPLLAFF